MLRFNSRIVGAASAFFISSFVFLSQIYILPSGNPQFGHWFGLISIGIAFFWLFPKFPVKNNSSIFLIYFSLYAFVLNAVWVIKLNDLSFLRDNFYILYNFLIFISLLLLMPKHAFAERGVIIGGVAGILFLLLVWILGYGRYNSGLRYNGFFNDPNQMAFWVLCVSAICILLSKSQVTRVVVLFLAVFLVTLTLSRSGLLGIVPLVLGGLLIVLSSFSLQKRLVMLAVIPVSVLALAYFGYFEFLIPLIDRFLTTDFATHGDIRGYTRILNYPEYLMFGAGKGLDWRFGTHYEIHSTWAGILFYYGVVGLGLVLFALYKIASRLTVAEKLLFLAPLAFGFATYGFRTPIFWVFLAVFAHVSLSRRRFGPSSLKVEENRGTLVSEPYLGKPV